MIGLLGLIYKQNIIVVSAIYIFSVFYIYKKNLKAGFLKALKSFKEIKTDLLGSISLLILVSQAAVNLVGVMGPELGFDALWYHLVIPKLYLESYSIFYIPGGLLYYSAMPKLAEMLYVAGLVFGNEIFAKLIHFSFGILSLVALYKLSHKFFSMKWALLVCVVFYSNLVVGWQSITAYIDLSRTFFEIMALWGFINFIEKVEPLPRFNLERNKWLAISAIMLGLAISIKLLAIGSLVIFSILIIYFSIKMPSFKLKSLFTNILVYWWVTLLIPLPWFIFSYINTGNPAYPFFSNIYPVEFNFSLINPLNLSDPINPLYVILAPIGLLFFNKQEQRIKIISLYAILTYVVWQLTPNTGGGRFLLPYLPAFSILSVWVISKIWKLKIRPIILGFVIFFSLFSIVYRFGANSKYIPVVVGIQSKSDFLTKNLNFSFGDFYDTDGYFRKNIKDNDKVLLYGFHNLYYVDFPFIDSSWVKKGDEFNYIAVQNSNLPKRFSSWNRIYYNPLTHVKLYSQGGKKWIF